MVRCAEAVRDREEPPHEVHEGELEVELVHLPVLLQLSR